MRHNKSKKPAPNRIVYASGLKALGLHSARSATPPTPHSGTFLRLRETLRVSFIATAKTSYTTGTLCEIGAKYF
jgi:hypothetical protein